MKVNEEYIYDDVVVVAGGTLDLTNADNKRVRYLMPMISGGSAQGRFRGNTAGLKKDHSSTGIYTAADAQCVAFTQGPTLVNLDKVYVSTASTCAFRCLIVDSESK